MFPPQLCDMRPCARALLYLPLPCPSVMRLAVAALLSLLLSVAVMAQAPPSADAILDGWVRQQRAAFDALESLRFVEVTQRRIESPFATRTARIERRVLLRERRLERELVEATIDGEPADEERVRKIEKRLMHALGEDFRAASRFADAPAYHLGRLRPDGRPRHAQHDGRPAWEVVLSGDQEEGPIEAAVLWFLRNGPAPVLLGSRVQMRCDEPANRITIRTRYDDVQGPAGALAIPRTQTVEALLQQRRRWRTFTVTLHAERQLEAIEARWKD